MTSRGIMFVKNMSAIELAGNIRDSAIVCGFASLAIILEILLEDYKLFLSPTYFLDKIIFNADLFQIFLSKTKNIPMWSIAL
ncbi:hypothetical protein HZS_8186 [Henneguya salminicola]|nr:hypothetical protein HZS_8186 [Henneguya salminicola]